MKHTCTGEEGCEFRYHIDFDKKWNKKHKDQHEHKIIIVRNNK